MSLSKGSWTPTSGMIENWLVQIEDSSGSNTKYLSFKDQSVGGNSYLGLIINIPSIREKIDLMSSKSSISNVDIQLSNHSNVAEDLLYGSNYYLNRDVKIYSCLETGTVANLNNIPLLFTGRLQSMSHNDTSISLSVVAKMPWDGVDLPNTYSNEKIPVPLIYGDYTGNDDPYPGGGTNNWHPAPLTNVAAGRSFFVTGDDSGSSMNPSIYVSKLDGFIPIQGADTSTTQIGSAHTLSIPESANYTFSQAPTSSTTIQTHGTITEPSFANVFDKDTSTQSTVSYSENVSTSASRTHRERFTVPLTTSDAQLTLYYKVTQVSGVDQESGFPKVTVKMHGSHINTVEVEKTSIDGVNQTLTATLTDEVTVVDVDLIFEGDAAEDTSGGQVNIQVELHELVVSNPKTQDTLSKIYVDNDGRTKSFSSGTCTTLVEFHRDILNRYLGTSIDSTSYNALDSARGWVGRLWELKPKKIKSILDKLAYESGFCYTYTSSGSIKYIFVQNTYSSSDHTLDKGDVDSFSISHTSLSEMTTDITVNFNKHPAKNEFRSQTTDNDSTIRSNYNLSNDEGKKTVNLEYLTASVGSDLTATDNDPNDGFIEYYGNLSIQPRVVIVTSIINPAKFKVELGDIVQFTNMPTNKFFNKTISSLYFMITSLSRSSGRIELECMDVTPNAG
jgi:hypothetical protein